LLGDLDDFHDGFKSVASLYFPLFLLGNLTDAWPAVLLHGKGPLHAVEVGSLVLSLFLGSLVAVLESLIRESGTFLDFTFTLVDESGGAEGLSEGSSEDGKEEDVFEHLWCR
jgi:hypothetical protein